MSGLGLVALGFAAGVLVAVVGTRRRTWRPPRVDEQFIGSYSFPAGMLDKARSRCPEGTAVADLDAGLRQFLVIAGRRMALQETAAMPSSTVDEAWHEFLLHTRGYASFCERAFGRHLHHHPEVAMSAQDVQHNRTAAFAATWVAACELEGRDPWTTPEAPALFAVDARSGVPGARTYVGTCGGLSHCQTTDGVVCVAHEYLGVPLTLGGLPVMPVQHPGKPVVRRRPASRWFAGGDVAGSSDSGHTSCGSSSGCSGGGGCGGGGCGGGGCGGGN